MRSQELRRLQGLQRRCLRSFPVFSVPSLVAVARMRSYLDKFRTPLQIVEEKVKDGPSWVTGGSQAVAALFSRSSSPL